MRNGQTAVPDRAGDTLGYARMSTVDQDLAGQEDHFEKAGAIRIFTDVVSGGKFDRPRLIAERTRDGIVAARKRGSIPVRPSRAWPRKPS